MNSLPMLLLMEQLFHLQIASILVLQRFYFEYNKKKKIEEIYLLNKRHPT